MGSVKKEYSESKKYSTDIMNDIIEMLTKKKVPYDVNSNKTEITIKSSKHSKASIKSMITENISKPGSIMSLLIDVVDVNDTIYIRQISK